MQTFLPYPSFQASAQALDYRRLGKQRVEVLQLLKALAGESRGWRNHPATNMWRGYEKALIWYGIKVCTEWTRRGYKDTCLDKIKAYWSIFNNGYEWVADQYQDIPWPHWLTDSSSSAFHASHRSNLLRKDPAFYSQYDWEEGPDLEYVWPV